MSIRTKDILERAPDTIQWPPQTLIPLQPKPWTSAIDPKTLDLLVERPTRTAGVARGKGSIGANYAELC